MDEAKRAEVRHMLSQVSLELAQAAEAAKNAAGATAQDEAWKQVQLLYTRFDEASQLLRDLRRTVDAALKQG